MHKILAIDDNQDNLITISALLKNFLGDCTVLTALSGPEGIDKARTEQPDTIILDIKMPGMDGFEACGLLKKEELTRHIPIILLTALRTDVTSRIKGLEIGADAFLTKPIDEAELIAQIKVMLRIKKAEDMLRREKDLLEEMVTERTMDLIESERQLIKERDFIRSLEDASPAYYVAVDQDGKIITMNRSLLEAGGYSLHEVCGMNFAENFVPQTECAVALHAFKKLLKTRDVVVSENMIKSKEGKELLVEWHGRTFYKKDDSFDFIFFVGIDITERKRLEKIVLNSVESERHRIGQELHDRLGQNLAAIAFKSEILRLKLKDIQYTDLREIDSFNAMINDAIAQTRDLARNLSPVDMAAGGLAAAFEELGIEVEKENSISCLLDIDEDIENLTDLEASNLYYITQEAIENAVVHGKAKNIVISLLSRNNSITLTVVDDGAGLPDSFDQSGGVGIRIMNYRAWIISAAFSISNNAGGGVIVTCILRKQEGARHAEKSDSEMKKYLVSTNDRRAGVLIVDDHPIVREGLTQIINREKDLYVCGEAQTTEETVKLVAKLNPHLVITDISVEGASGLDLIKALKTRYTGLPVLVLSIYDETIYAERSLRAGARGYVMKQEAPQTVVTAIRTVLDGKQYISDRVREHIIQRMPYDKGEGEGSPLEALTIREFEVFQCVGHGMSNKNIAEKLNVSVKTVENYRERIKNKLNLDSSSHMMQYAVQWVIDQSKHNGKL